MRGEPPEGSKIVSDAPLAGSTVERFRGGLAFKAHRLLYHSRLGLILIKKKKKIQVQGRPQRICCQSSVQNFTEIQKTQTPRTLQ